ncbi:hypothetical protein AB0H63_23610 [Micromonospora echinospora]|uniref:hypothetical protein n=1 Tax=Micromonospora echinospora TaxID=1877 RepID=UPI0033CF1CD5
MDDVHGADHQPSAPRAGWAWLHVSHYQYEVSTVPGTPGMIIYALGDDLLHIRGPNHFNGFCDIHTGCIEALGLIWDHLLDAPGSYPWIETLHEQAAKATALAERFRRLEAARLAEQWGGAPPWDRVRRLISQASSPARLDRPLPPSFTEHNGWAAFDRLLSDPEVPHTSRSASTRERSARTAPPRCSSRPPRSPP